LPTLTTANNIEGVSAWITLLLATIKAIIKLPSRDRNRAFDLSQVGFFGYPTGSFVGRVAVNAGRMVRRYDRRLDNATRSTFGSTRYISALGGGLGRDGRRALRGIGVRHQFYRRSLLLGHHHGSSGKEKEEEK